MSNDHQMDDIKKIIDDALASSGPDPRNAGSPFLADPEMTAHLLAVAVKKLGGSVTFTQSDMDDIDGLVMDATIAAGGESMTLRVGK